MPNYKAMYFELAAKVADAIEILTKAQRDCEDSYCAEQPGAIEINADSEQ